MLTALLLFPLSTSNGLASGVGFEILSFLVLPLPFISELGSCIALLMLLPLTFRECPLLLPLLAVSRLLPMDMLLKLMFLLCVVELALEEPNALSK